MTISVLNAADGPDIRSALKPRLNRASAAQPMAHVQEQEHLAQADWHITEVKAHIVRQRVRVMVYVAELQLMTSLAVHRTIANEDPPAAVP
jgi:hypothetical protein